MMSLFGSTFTTRTFTKGSVGRDTGRGMDLDLFLEPSGRPRGFLEDGVVTCWLVEVAAAAGGLRWEEEPMWWSSEETESE